MLESAQNDTYKKLLSLTSAKGLKEGGLFLLSGEKLIREFLEKPNLEVVYEVMGPKHTAITSSQPIQLSNDLYGQIDVVGTHFNVLVLKQPEIPVLDIAAHKPDGIELVVPIGDPGNLGALIRSAEAFGVPRVILTREAAHPFLPKAVKASAGSVLRMKLARGPALAEFPDSSIALDSDGTLIDQFTWPQQGLLLLGEEGVGFGSRQYPTRVRIPTAGVESLNVVVAASVALSRLPKRN